MIRNDKNNTTGKDDDFSGQDTDVIEGSFMSSFQDFADDEETDSALETKLQDAPKTAPEKFSGAEIKTPNTEANDTKPPNAPISAPLEEPPIALSQSEKDAPTASQISARADENANIQATQPIDSIQCMSPERSGEILNSLKETRIDNTLRSPENPDEYSPEKAQEDKPELKPEPTLQEAPRTNAPLSTPGQSLGAPLGMLSSAKPEIPILQKNLPEQKPELAPIATPTPPPIVAVSPAIAPIIKNIADENNANKEVNKTESKAQDKTSPRFEKQESGSKNLIEKLQDKKQKSRFFRSKNKSEEITKELKSLPLPAAEAKPATPPTPEKPVAPTSKKSELIRPDFVKPKSDESQTTKPDPTPAPQEQETKGDGFSFFESQNFNVSDDLPDDSTSKDLSFVQRKKDLTSEEFEDLDPLEVGMGLGLDPSETGNNLPADNKGRELQVQSTDLTKTKKDIDPSKKVRIGDMLMEKGLISESQLNVALQEKKVSGKMLGEIMVDLGFISEDTLNAFMAEAYGFDLFDPKNTIFDGEVLALIDKKIAMQHSMLPIAIKGEELFVAMADPYDIVAMDTLRRFVPKNLSIRPMICTPKIMGEAIDVAYGYASSVNAILEELEGDKNQVDIATLSEEQAFSHPIVRLVNALVFEAVKIGASDLHFEPEENFIRLRYRKDGVLFTAQILHRQHWSGISQRIKIMSGMNIADKLGAQDGRFGMNVGGRMADFRVSSLPTVNGENIVLRVLDQSESIMPMEKLGFSPHNLALIKKSQSKPEGIIIVTGPTGSGKTTSLYSMLNEINDVEVNIQTLEDPVEYSLPMIRQTHVREGVLEFADGIKALLRQDPDIIFIGEIRDGETAGMALKAAMTGHQVYTTLHTNDSFGAIPRLFDLGLKPGMVSGAIIAIFAQRLTRRLCSDCRVEYTPSEEEAHNLGLEENHTNTIFKAKQGGCNMCEGQGYKGRTAVVEILTFDEELNELLAKGESKAELKAVAVKKGFKSMRDDGMLKVLEGVTSLEALARVVDVNR